MKNNKLKLNTILHTKDGRKIGNAIIIGKENEYNIIKTDYGNEYRLTNSEVLEYFYIAYSDLTKEEKQYIADTIENHKHSVKINNR